MTAFTYEKVKTAVLANDCSRAPGFNQIKPIHLMNEVCINFSHVIYNYCFQHGVVPNACVKGEIKPIPKSNPKSLNPSEYRGISLQSFLAKSYLNSKLREWLELKVP